MTGYENIRRMSDEELTEYFKKFAKHYYHLGEVDTIYDKQKDDISLMRCLDKSIGKHSNEI